MKPFYSSGSLSSWFVFKSASGQTEHMNAEKKVIISNVMGDTDVHYLHTYAMQKKY